MTMDDIYKLKYLAGITDRNGNKVKEDNGGSNTYYRRKRTYPT